jgi:methylase of polypeptide subunit release factors
MQNKIVEIAFELINQNEQIQDRYEFNFQGFDFVGFPGVFSPIVFSSSSMWQPLSVKDGNKLLEIGSGTGCISLAAALKSAVYVTAVDIEPCAVENTLYNIELHKLEDRVRTYQSDVFSNVSEYDYDIIFWNVPWIPTEKKGLSSIEKGVFDSNFELLERYISEAKNFLAPNGKVLVGYSSTHGNIRMLYCLAQKYNWNIELLYQVQSPDIVISADMFELKSL